MSGRVLLDTNIVIALFAKEAVIQQRLAETDEVFVSSVVLGELYYGAQKSSRVEANIARVSTFAAANAVLAATVSTVTTTARPSAPHTMTATADASSRGARLAIHSSAWRGVRCPGTTPINRSTTARTETATVAALGNDPPLGSCTAGSRLQQCE